MLAFNRFAPPARFRLAVKRNLPLAQTESSCPSHQEAETALNRCLAIGRYLRDAGLFTPFLDHDPPVSPQAASWRISPRPFVLSADHMAFFKALGPQLFSFYRALNRLYHESAKGTQPAWIARYLDQGKPDGLVAYSRMKRFRESLPTVIRPDVIPTQDGMIITELDSVPGGIGLTAAMSHAYTDHDREHTAFNATPRYELIGGGDGMVRGFAAMLRAAQRQNGCIAIVVSDEAKDYRPEMAWLAIELRQQGVPVWCVEPRELRFTEGELRLHTDEGEQRVGLIYRFYELFDLPNIPKAELIQYAAKKEWVAITPPYKPALEEKSAFALLHHPVLRSYWDKQLGADCFLHLRTVMPRTWILDPAPIPPTAVIADLYVGERPVSDWTDLEAATQKERHFVIKPSGFSELAWGSRGVSIGHDLSQTEWAGTLRRALASFPTTPHVLQEFHKGRLFEMDYLDERTGSMARMAGRARLSPYYFVTGEEVRLAGILATICPADKKIIHGMQDAVMTPCALVDDAASVNGEDARRTTTDGRTGSPDRGRRA
ncbi:conserved protein of unknown function [Candidatus Nitrospira inopinata]|uniref:Glutathionylspermidine synthase pre-ATP-grasp-like domain-containing protein n=1 Tax=Candidatus Nitrospira inopinata TaxID=1715989 RepID=A0A0S4KPA8_9BACT|nr:conserved protein of unknown function [Candidatus Nitrospira inopinata]